MTNTFAQASEVTDSSQPAPVTVGWLADPTTDKVFIFGVLLLALALGAVAMRSESAFHWVILADFWLLAYPHVGSMYTRIAGRKDAIRSHWFLLFGLPPLVFLFTLSTHQVFGLVGLNTLYFYWQTWHYSRQSYGIARGYQRAASPSSTRKSRDLLTDCLIFAVPTWGLLHRAGQNQGVFYGTALWTPALPRSVETIGAAFTLVVLAGWMWRQMRRLESEGAAHLGLTLFVLSHVIVTGVSYLFISNTTQGWLFINLWHNAQYLFFVWIFQRKAHRSHPAPSSPSTGNSAKSALEWLFARDPNATSGSESKAFVRYFAVCAGFAGLFYFTLGLLLTGITQTGLVGMLPLVLIVHQSVNFHHYLVDAVIWRSPRTKAKLAN